MHCYVFRITPTQNTIEHINRRIIKWTLFYIFKKFPYLLHIKSYDQYPEEHKKFKFLLLFYCSRGNRNGRIIFLAQNLSCLFYFNLFFLIAINYFITDNSMCIYVIVIDITQPVHVVFQNISLSIAETTQSVFRFFVSSFVSLHCEDSHTISIFIKSCSCYLWHIKSQNMHVESFISSWISFVFCEKTLNSNLVEFFHIDNVIFQLLFINCNIFNLGYHKEWWNFLPQKKTFTQVRQCLGVLKIFF